MVKLFSKIFDTQINSITVAAIFIAGSSLASRILGIFRDRILAGEFGAGDTLDVYYAAFRIPDMIYGLLIMGALSAGFIPIFTDLIKDEKNCRNNCEAWRFSSNILNIMMLGMIALIIIAFWLAPNIMKAIVPGFSPEKQKLTVELTRIMFLSPLFLGISNVFSGILQSFKRFFVYSLSPIFYNIGIIIGALYFTPLYGIRGLAWGVVLGAFLHMLVQVPLTFKLGYRPAFILDLKDKLTIKLGRMMIPRTLTLAVGSINDLIIAIIASTLASGSLAIYNLADNLQSFPVGIFGISFAVAAFPSLSKSIRDAKKTIEHFSATFRQILFFIIPASILFLTLRAQIVRALLGTGAFTWRDTILTIDTLGFFMIGLFAQASIPLLVRMFFARKDSKTPFYIGIATVFANILLSLWLPNAVFCGNIFNWQAGTDTSCTTLGVSGLALAFSLSSIFNFTALWIFLKKIFGRLDEQRIILSVTKFIFASVIMGLVIQGMKVIVWPYVDMTRTWGIIIQGGFAGLVGAFVYLAACSLFKSEELAYLVEALKRRIAWKKVETEDQGEVRGI